MKKLILYISLFTSWQISTADNFTVDVSALNSGSVSSAKLACKTPSSRFSQCTATANPVINGAISDGTVNFNLSQIQHVAFPSDQRCPVDSLSCDFSINGTVENHLEFSNIAYVPCGNHNCWAMTNLQDTPVNSNTQSDFETKSNQITYSKYTSYFQNWHDNLYSIESGYINFTGQVATPPAILQCGNNTVKAVTHDDKTGFPIRQLFAGSNPNKAATVTDCEIKDSSANSPTYAVFNEIDEIAAEKTETSTSAVWVADIENFNYGNADFLVTRPVGNNPSQTHPDAYNQWNMSIQAIAGGKINFKGLTNTDSSNLQLTCDQHSPITLDKNYSLSLAALHDADKTINSPTDFQHCQLASTDGQTVYVQFTLSHLVGNLTTGNSQASWTSDINGVQTVAANFATNPTIVKTDCYNQLPDQCADWTITLNKPSKLTKQAFI